MKAKVVIVPYCRKILQTVLFWKSKRYLLLAIMKNTIYFLILNKQKYVEYNRYITLNKSNDLLPKV